MRRWQLRLGLAALLLAGSAGPGQAAEPAFPTRIFTPACEVEFASAAVDQGAAGDTRGFVERNGPGCDPDARVRYVEGSGARWAAPEVTPYRGMVLAAAADRGGTWLLFRAVSGIWLGRRTGPGVYTRPRQLSGFTGPQSIVHTGDLVARRGRWWAVWTEQVGPGADRARTELFEAGTLADEAVGRRPVTRHPWLDDEPSLALHPGSDRLTLAWVRRRPDAATSQLHVGRAAAGEPWTAAPVSRPGTLSLSPTVTAAADGAILVWRQGIDVMVATPVGSIPVRVPATPGILPTAAVTGEGLHLGWTVPGTRGRALVAARRDGRWVEHLVAPGLDAGQTLIGLTESGDGAVTALLLTEGGDLYAVGLPGDG